MPGASDVVVTGIAYDSREVAPGHVFVALRGLHTDGSFFVRQAVDRGAVAIVSEEPSPVVIPALQVDDARSALAILAAEFEGHPSEKMRVIGITGTNGKTTTCIWSPRSFRPRASNAACSTVAYRIGDEVRESKHDAGSARRAEAAAGDGGSRLRRLRDGGVSHALALRRVDAMTFSAGVSPT
jgi:UDP-N-acetylmuramoyl-L-alanyl-D-glutamate--2,6-diaminopimelate ligase